MTGARSVLISQSIVFKSKVSLKRPSFKLASSLLLFETMTAVKLSTITFLFLTLSSCNQKKNIADFSSTTPLEKYEQVSLDPMIVRVQGKDESKLASLKLSYTGCENLKKQLNSQQETLQNLIIQTLSNYKFESLRTEKGKSLFQKKLLSSLNQFVEGRELVRIDVVEFTEI